MNVTVVQPKALLFSMKMALVLVKTKVVSMRVMRHSMKVTGYSLDETR